MLIISMPSVWQFIGIGINITDTAGERKDEWQQNNKSIDMRDLRLRVCQK